VGRETPHRKYKRSGGGIQTPLSNYKTLSLNMGREATGSFPACVMRISPQSGNFYGLNLIFSSHSDKCAARKSLLFRDPLLFLPFY
jgi:hypothetical protein